MNRAILIHEKLGKVEEIDLDISPEKNEIFKLLGGRQTFIGQWPDIDVVIMKAENGHTKNENVLPAPFNKEEVLGKILLVRMDENSEPQNFKLREYRWYKRMSV
jgi:sporulation protein YlmC with PRC-barrel domain